ncbi:hypothetical protein ykris0001_39020 [Yersinia kristensenii ATCC 33638]|nr:hypothetical protein ykris0001_39020 [Yersinia kristensenii ATCC 33638]
MLPGPPVLIKYSVDQFATVTSGLMLTSRVKYGINPAIL